MLSYVTLLLYCFNSNFSFPGAYTLFAAVVFLHKCGLLVSFAYYPLLFMTAIMALSITSSIISREVSLDMTSAIFSVIWVPLSVILKTPGNPTDHLTDTVRYRACDSSTGQPTYLRQCVFHFMFYRCLEDPPNFGCITWVAVFNLVLQLVELLTACPGEREQGRVAQIFQPSFQAIFIECLVILGLAIFSFGAASPLTLLASTCFCVLTSASTKNLLVKDLGEIATDILDGLEKEYIEAIMLFVDVFVHLIFLIIGLISYDILLVFLSCASMYYPLRDVRASLWKRIQSERAALIPFPRAGISKLLRHDDVCPVCLCTMKAARMTPCGHMFHSRCLRMCLKEKPVCPLCMQNIDVPT